MKTEQEVLNECSSQENAEKVFLVKYGKKLPTENTWIEKEVELTPSDLSHLIALLKSEIKKYPNLEGEEGKTLLKKLSEVSKC